jgi:hypothetical protein
MGCIRKFTLPSDCAWSAMICTLLSSVSAKLKLCADETSDVGDTMSELSFLQEVNPKINVPDIRSAGSEIN